MAKPKEVLSTKDYTNYRSVRAALVLFVVLGSILVLGAIGGLAAEKRDIPPAAAVVMAIVALAGVVGGTAALIGSSGWAKLAYVMAVPYLLIFPIGTIMGYIVLSGLSRYLDSKERVRQQAIDDANDALYRRGRE